MERIHHTGADQGAGKKSFKQSIRGTCLDRNDQWTNEVCILVHGSISDLHAAEAGYYGDFVS